VHATSVGAALLCPWCANPIGSPVANRATRWT
jgi:hypothetical protein